MNILGISAFFHDSAAALIVDGRVVCAFEEERFSRIKHDNQFPVLSIQHCLDTGGLSVNDIDSVVYYEKPLLKLERILDTFIQTFPRSLRPFVANMPEILIHKLDIAYTLRKTIGFRGQIFYLPHHLSHAAAAFLTSSFKESAILTVDGTGEYQTTALWAGNSRRITELGSLNFPHSLGLFYSTFTAFLGFRVNDDEYKVMGLSAYGKPSFVSDMRRLIDMAADGSLRLNMDYFGFQHSEQMWAPAFEKLFGRARARGDPMTKHHKDIAASVQALFEEIYFRILNHLQTLTNSSDLCLGGGVALNALANGKIYTHTKFKRVHIFGAAGDSGSAIGAALYMYHQLNQSGWPKPITGMALGSSYKDAEIEDCLGQTQLKWERVAPKKLIAKTAQLLANGKVVGWFQGKMEFGPRALGYRSILADPRPAAMKSKINRIKGREAFRPFGGSIIDTATNLYLEAPGGLVSPFMIECFRVRSAKKDSLAAITHYDGSCRIQTVTPQNERFYQLINAFRDLTGTPCLLNTSFNVAGEPMVEHPSQALEVFATTTLDYLVIGNFMVRKE